MGSLLLHSCFDGASPYQDMLPDSIGLSGEVVVILRKQDKEGALGKVILNDLRSPCLQYLSYEPQFTADLYQFDKFSKQIKKFRNVVIVNIKDTISNSTPSTVFRKDKWADGQAIVFINAKDTTSAIAEYRAQAERIKEVFNTRDRERYTDIVKRVSDPVSKEKIINKFGVSLDIPNDYFFVSESEHHLGFKKDKSVFKGRSASQVMQNIVIRVEPFDSDSAFSNNSIIQGVDSVTGKYYQSADDYGMIIEKRQTPKFKEINYDGKYGVEMKALWKFESPLMGDPYTSLTIHDPDKNRVITVEGFMFAPRFDKREYMKEIESILYSLEFL